MYIFYIILKNIFKYQRFHFNIGEHLPLVGATSERKHLS